MLPIICRCRRRLRLCASALFRVPAGADSRRRRHRRSELEKSVRISGRIDTHPFTQTITLRKGERKIGFDLKIDWQHNVGIGAFRQKDGFIDKHGVGQYPGAIAGPAADKAHPDQKKYYTSGYKGALQVRGLAYGSYTLAVTFMGYENCSCRCAARCLRLRRRWSGNWRYSRWRWAPHG